MGEGTAAALMAATIRSAVRAAPEGDPAGLLNQVAETLLYDLDVTGILAMAIQATIDTVKGEITYADAGHGLAVGVRASAAPIAAGPWACSDPHPGKDPPPSARCCSEDYQCDDGSQDGQRPSAETEKTSEAAAEDERADAPAEDRSDNAQEQGYQPSPALFSWKGGLGDGSRDQAENEKSEDSHDTPSFLSATRRPVITGHTLSMISLLSI
ncbi:SpoIIE family protein phosphatase [Arthrobacter sp. ISL-65]|nr:SpoIIE family protein phosphatase [Arthrobacter sp. ISL-65]